MTSVDLTGCSILVFEDEFIIAHDIASSFTDAGATVTIATNLADAMRWREHTAGTEFMIGPLFVAWGASAFSLIFGLLLGNLLAVLTWRFLTATIATRERLTLYFKMEKIIYS